jgi:hypothetical protein
MCSLAQTITRWMRREREREREREERLPNTFRRTCFKSLVRFGVGVGVTEMAEPNRPNRVGCTGCAGFFLTIFEKLFFALQNQVEFRCITDGNAII